MALEAGRETQTEDETEKAASAANTEQGGAVKDEERSEDEEDDDEDEEPRLKYSSLTQHLKIIYRNGDSTSIFLVAGDKMVVGTHNGHIHVFSVPSLAHLRSYHAHSASTSALSIAPYPPSAPSSKPTFPPTNNARTGSPQPSFKQAGKNSPKRPSKQPKPSPSTSNTIYIGSSSIDGNVCVASLVDTKDVLLRSFGRPVQSVGISPEYRSDRSYLSGGLAGSLVLTVGGQIGTKSTANISGASAAASGWLGSLGLGSNSGKDTVLHSGEGAISNIKWSLSGKYIVWVNEQGIKLMRSGLHLASRETEAAWKRFSHIDHPNRPGWDEMAGIWKAHVEWVDEEGLESDVLFPKERPDGTSTATEMGKPRTPKPSDKIEKLVVGWSGTIWIVDVHPGVPGDGKQKRDEKIARAEIVTILRIDCIISGIALYTPTLLLVLAYLAPDQDASNPGKPRKKGVSRRQNALPPEIRLINIETKEEVTIADTLEVSRHEGLSATDYHFEVLPELRASKSQAQQRGALEAIGGGIEAIGGGIRDATLYSAKLFSSAASVRSSESQDSGTKRAIAAIGDANLADTKGLEAPAPLVLARGMKLFIHSPYDCLIGTKPTLSDHLTWLTENYHFQDAWEFLDMYPEAAMATPDLTSESPPSTPTESNLDEFLTEESVQSQDSTDRYIKLALKKEKARLANQWLDNLVRSDAWNKAAKVATQILSTSAEWQYWVGKFAQAGRFDAVTTQILSKQSQSVLPSKVYETLMRHYLSKDLKKFAELLDAWSSKLSDPSAVVMDIENKFNTGELPRSFPDDHSKREEWRLLISGLAKLYLVAGSPRKALSCYIRLQRADDAMELIQSSHIIDAVSDDIPAFVLLRVTKTQQQAGDMAVLARQTKEPIQMLVTEAQRGIVKPEMIVNQLSDRLGIPNPYLYFYFQALWHGESSSSAESRPVRRGLLASEQLLAAEGRNIVSDYADLAVTLFATYDRDLLMTFLKSSQSYNLSQASMMCEKRGYIPELIYLLSKEGRTAKALRLIIDDLNDVSQAISFAKEQNDASLWDDLLEYSMNKPNFIRALLEEVGTAINPIELVQRIPQGIEIEGLGDALRKMLKEYELQDSICKGVAKVLASEANAAMQERNNGLRRGIKLDIAHLDPTKTADNALSSDPVAPKDIKLGHCAACNEPLDIRSISGNGVPPQFRNGPYILAFPCTHAFHLPCLLTHYFLPPDSDWPAPLVQFLRPSVGELHALRKSSLQSGAVKGMGAEQDDTLDGEAEPAFGLESYSRNVAPKIDRARLLRGLLGKGCPLESVTNATSTSHGVIVDR